MKCAKHPALCTHTHPPTTHMWQAQPDEKPRYSLSVQLARILAKTVEDGAMKPLTIAQQMRWFFLPPLLYIYSILANSTYIYIIPVWFRYSYARFYAADIILRKKKLVREKKCWKNDVFGLNLSLRETWSCSTTSCGLYGVRLVLLRPEYSGLLVCVRPHSCTHVYTVC